jgi:hypothetical protein
MKEVREMCELRSIGVYEYTSRRVREMCELRRQEFREREAVDSSGQQRIAVGIYGGYREIIFFI